MGSAPDRSLPCPRCGGFLTEVEVSSHYGSRVVVDRCEGCGGLFASWGKLLAISPDLPPSWIADPEGQRALVHRTLRCPVCGIELEPIGASEVRLYIKIPGSVDMEVCRAGHGFWLAPDQLARLKRGQVESLERMRRDYESERPARAGAAGGGSRYVRAPGGRRTPSFSAGGSSRRP